MATPPDSQKRAWIRRVLGIGAGEAEAASLTRSLSLSDAVRSSVLASDEADALMARGDAAGARTLAERARLLSRESERRQALADWRAAQEVAVHTLVTLEMLMRGSTVPQRDTVIVLIQGIRARLTGQPDTPEAVASLIRYIKLDPLVGSVEGPNVFGLTVSLRNPLLDALAAFEKTMDHQAETG
jgi:hypothetical protein